jgi:hypothetical protein
VSFTEIVVALKEVEPKVAVMLLEGELLSLLLQEVMDATVVDNRAKQRSVFFISCF